MIDFIPEAQALFNVVASAESGKPNSIQSQSLININYTTTPHALIYYI